MLSDISFNASQFVCSFVLLGTSSRIDSDVEQPVGLSVCLVKPGLHLICDGRHDLSDQLSECVFLRPFRFLGYIGQSRNEDDLW